MKSLRESLFDNNLASKEMTLPDGCTIDHDKWDEDTKFITKMIKEYFKNIKVGDTFVMGPAHLICTLRYKDKDTLVYTNDIGTDIAVTYVICPETVYICSRYMPYVDKYDAVRDSIRHDEYRDFLVRLPMFHFAYYCYLKKWNTIYDQVFNKGKHFEQWMPITINTKAEKIIKKLIG